MLDMRQKTVHIMYMLNTPYFIISKCQYIIDSWCIYLEKHTWKFILDKITLNIGKYLISVGCLLKLKKSLLKLV